MKRFLALPLLVLGGFAWAGGGFNGLTVSSGTFQSISTYGNNDGGNRQAIILGDRTSSDTVKTDGQGALVAYVINPTTATVSGTVSANASQTGTWTVQPGNTANTTAWKVDGSAVTQPISGNVGQSGAWTVSPGSGVYRVDGSAITQPVSGTVSANQSGTWTVQPGNTANSTAWLVDPSHAVDSSLNASVSIKGSSNTVTAVGASSDTANNLTTKLPVLAARSNSSAPTWVEGGMVPLSVDNAGALRVSGSAGGGVADLQIRNSANSWADVGYGGTVVSSVPVSIINASLAAVGNVAGGASDSGNPVKIGGIGHTTYQTAVTDTQRVDAAFDSEGKQVSMPYSIPALFASGTTAAMTGTTQSVLISSGGASINTYVTGISCFNSHATVGTVINIRNAQTLKYTGYAVAAGGGFAVTFPTPLAGASNSQWSADNATTGSNTYCNMTGYYAKN